LLDSNQDAKRAFLNKGKKVEPYGTLAQFRRHLGRHMEQLALFALPIDEVEEAEDQSDSQSDDNESARSEIDYTKDANSVLEEASRRQFQKNEPISAAEGSPDAWSRDETVPIANPYARGEDDHDEDYAGDSQNMAFTVRIMIYLLY
jgi:hypothetical protein